MNLMEYQGKELLRRAGIPVPRGRFAATPDAVAEFLDEVPGEWVIKAQVLMGGRGKAGKIKMAAGASQGRSLAAEIMATPMPPNRQNPLGEPVRSLLVEERLPIVQEAYCAITIDRAARKPVIVVSRFGGMEIEEVAERHPESIAKFYVDSAIGYSPFIGRELAFGAQLDPGYRKQFPAIAGALYDLFFRYGAKLIEINPLALTSDGHVVASDAKIELDDDALFRNPEFDEWRATLPAFPRQRRYVGKRCRACDGDDGRSRKRRRSGRGFSRRRRRSRRATRAELLRAGREQHRRKRFLR
jgi:succinyl-CoA synthetase beta subunit